MNMHRNNIFTEENIDNTKKVIKKLLWATADIGLTVAFLKAFGLLPSVKMTKDEKPQNRKHPEDIYQESCTNYGDAIAAITKSSMLGSDKKAAIALVKVDQKPEYYDAIISVVTSSMLGADKVSTIAEIGGKE